MICATCGHHTTTDDERAQASAIIRKLLSTVAYPRDLAATLHIKEGYVSLILNMTKNAEGKFSAPPYTIEKVLEFGEKQ